MVSGETIRARLEAICDLHQPYPMDDKCIECHQVGPCPTREHAVAALASLGDAERCGTGIQSSKTLDELAQCRLVPDPQPLGMPDA